jgi:hypothetical protein
MGKPNLLQGATQMGLPSSTAVLWIKVNDLDVCCALQQQPSSCEVRLPRFPLQEAFRILQEQSLLSPSFTWLVPISTRATSATGRGRRNTRS